MRKYIIGWSCGLALFVGMFAPFPVGFKDQDRGWLIGVSFAAGAGIGCLLGLIHKFRNPVD